LTSRKLTMDSCSRRRRKRISRISERILRLSEVRSMRSCLIATRCLVLLSSAEYTLDWPANLGCQAGTQIMHQLQGRSDLDFASKTPLSKQMSIRSLKSSTGHLNSEGSTSGGSHISSGGSADSPSKIRLISRKSTKRN
jgi:hypothetical protein